MQGSGSTRKKNVVTCRSKTSPIPLAHPHLHLHPRLQSPQCCTLFLETLRRLVVSVACAASDAIDDSSKASTRRRVQQESLR